MGQSTKTKKQNKQQSKKGGSEKASLKKQSTTKSSSCCCWFLGSFVLLGAICGVLVYDTNVNGAGVFEKSATGNFLKNIGALPYVQTAWFKTMSCSARAYKWSQTNLPIYYETIATVSKPYLQLFCDLLKIIRNALINVWEVTTIFVQNKTPIVVDFIEQYIPGLCKNIQDISISSWKVSTDVYKNSCEFFKTRVFVGSLSPENLGKALNETQITAAKYIRWFNEKVDVYANIK